MKLFHYEYSFVKNGEIFQKMISKNDLILLIKGIISKKVSNASFIAHLMMHNHKMHFESS